MGRFVMGAMLLVACGKVAELPDARTTDAPLDAVVCTGTQQDCGGTCVDTMTDMMNCGACANACQTGTEVCTGGTCTDNITTCAQIHMGNPMAGNGTYTLDSGGQLNCDMTGGTCAQMHTATPALPDGAYQNLDGSTMFCNMTDGGLTVSELAWGQYNVVTPGYTFVTLADFQSAGLQQLFITLFNKQGGANLIAPWNPGNCCFTSGTVGTQLEFGGAYIEPATPAGVLECGAEATPIESFEISGIGQIPPLPTTFFTTNPATSAAPCGDASNPAWFWKEM